MTRLFAVVFSSLLFVAVAAFSLPAEADVFNVIDVRARHIKSQANVLMEEANNH